MSDTRKEQEEDGRVRRARDRRQQTRAAIVHTARHMFAQDGYEQASPSRIAGAAGITRATFYQHFDGKADVFAAVLEDLTEQLRVAVLGVDLASDDLSAEQQLLANFMRVLQVLLSDGDYARLLLVEAVGKERVLNGRVDGFFRHMLTMIRDALDEGQDAGFVRPVEMDIASWAMLGMVKEVMLRALERDHGGIDEAERYRIAEELVICCMAGVGSKRVRDAAADTRR